MKREFLRGLEYSINLKLGTKIIIQKTQPLLYIIFATIKYSLYGCVPFYGFYPTVKLIVVFILQTKSESAMAGERKYIIT